MNLVPAIKQMEEQISELERDCAIKIDELNAGIVALRKLNTVCEACNGEGKRLRTRACAEDDRPDPNDLADYRNCKKCGGSGVAKYLKEDK